MATLDIGFLNSSYTATDTLGIAYPDDTYNFKLSDTGSLKLSLMGISATVDWQIANTQGTILHTGSISITNSDAINLYNLAAGDYSLQVSQASSDTNYTLKIDPLSGFEVESGFFTVGQTGQVGVDYLIDGGWYQGELGFFSLTGMEAFAPGEEEPLSRPVEFENRC